MKKLFNLLLISSAMLLASCDPNPVASSSEAPLPSSSETRKDEDFATLVAKMIETKSYTVSKYYQVVGKDSRTDVSTGMSKQFGPKALAQYNPETGAFLSGELINGEQGVFSFSIDNGSFVLGDFDKLCGNKDIDDLYYTPLTFSNMENWYKKNGSNAYESMDPDTLQAISTVSGLTAMASSMGIAFDFQAATATVEGDVITIVMDAYFDIEMGPVAAAKVVISDIGKTNNEVVANYLKSPTNVAPSTAWSATQLAEINTYFGSSKAIELPFPNKATYALSVTGQPAYQEVMIRDYLAGDIRGNYGAQLIRAGFENITESGDKANVYQKEVTDSDGLSTYTLYVSYSSQSTLAETYGTETASLFPNGLFQIEGVYSFSYTGITNGSLADVDSWLNSHLPTADVYPSLAASFPSASQASIIDDTEAYNAYFRSSLGLSFDYFDAAYSCSIMVADENAAKAAMASYLSAIKAKSWFSQQQGGDETLSYYYADSQKQYGIQVSLSTTKDGTYQGAVTIAFLDYSEIASSALNA